MINIWIVIAICFIHWVGYFVLQPDCTAINKSKSIATSLHHAGLYSSAWIIACILYTYPFNIGIEQVGQFESFCVKFVLVFPAITFLFHTAQEYVISRISAKLLNKDKRHYFLGISQFVSITQLVLTYYILS